MSELPNDLAETVRMQAKNRGDAIVFEFEGRQTTSPNSTATPIASPMR